MAIRQDRFTVRRLGTAYITTIVSIALVLFAIGLVGLVVLHAKKLSDFVRENISFTVIMNKNVREADVIQLQKKLDAKEYVKSTDYISEERAAEEYQEVLGQDFVKFIGYNPLHNSIEVHLKAEYAEPEYFGMIERELRENENVKEVFYQKSLVALVDENVRRISFILLAFSGLLMIVAIALINNTIRLSVFSKRFVIRSMQLVGATESFIRKPFLFRSVVHGFIASLLAICGLIGVIYISRKELPDIISLQQADLFLMLFVFVILVGFVISWISTFFAIRKFLRMRIDQLYY